MTLKNQIESLLFISHKPLAVLELAKLTGVDQSSVETVLAELVLEYQNRQSGLEILRLEDKYQMAAKAEASELIAKFLKTETSGELSRPSLETLTIVAYRGPISKAELELIRGVNCSLILRNLLLRGLVEAREDKARLTIVYQITFEFLKQLGLGSIKDLPEFDRLNRNNNLEKLLQSLSGGEVDKEIKEKLTDSISNQLDQ